MRTNSGERLDDCERFLDGVAGNSRKQGHIDCHCDILQLNLCEGRNAPERCGASAASLHCAVAASEMVSRNASNAFLLDGMQRKVVAGSVITHCPLQNKTLTRKKVAKTG